MTARLLLLVSLLLPAAATAGTPARGEAPAVERLADAFAAEVLAARAKAHGGVAALAFTASGEHGDEAAGGELGRLVERMVASRLRDGAGYDRVTEVPGGDLEAARAAARRSGAVDLVVAGLHRVGGELVLAGTLEPTWINFWTGEVEGETRALSARVRADRAAVLLARAAPGAAPTAGSLQLRPLTQVEGRIAALAVGDADGDGRAEIAVLTGRALTLLRVEDGGPRVLVVRDLAALPRALVPSRDPTGGVVITRIALRTAIAYDHSDLAEGEILAFDGTGLRRIAGLPETPIAAAAGSVVYAGLIPGSNLFQGALRLATPDGSRTVDAKGPVEGAALSPDGRSLLVIGGDWRLRWEPLAKGEAPEAGPTVGAGVALADVDGDGVLERIGSQPGPPGAEDRLVIAAAHGPVRELRPVPGAVRALAAGDATGDGRDDVVVGASAGDSSWIYLLSEDRP